MSTDKELRDVQVSVQDDVQNKLREEWYKCFEGERENMPKIMEKCADFWLSKLSLQQQKILERIKSKIIIDQCEDEEADTYEREVGYNQALNDIIKEIQ